MLFFLESKSSSLQELFDLLGHNFHTLAFCNFLILFQDVISRIIKKVVCHSYFRTWGNMQYEYRELLVECILIGNIFFL